MTIHALLILEGYEQLTKADRWQLIDQIERCIDQQQNWLSLVKPGGCASQAILKTIQQLRLKRFQIWSSFRPQTASLIKTAA